MTYVKTTLEDIRIPCEEFYSIDVIIRIDGRDEFTKELDWRIVGFDNPQRFIKNDLSKDEIDSLVEHIYENGLLDSSEFHTFEETEIDDIKYNLEEV